MVLINSEVDLKIKKFDDQSHMHLYVVRGAYFTTSDNPARSPGEPVPFVFRSVEHDCRVDKRLINALSHYRASKWPGAQFVAIFDATIRPFAKVWEPGVR